jgi:hypothetical protein
MFNRRHYEFVAESIREARAKVNDDKLETALNTLAWILADKFKEDNAAFDADKFYNATVDGVVRRPRVAKEG